MSTQIDLYINGDIRMKKYLVIIVCILLVIASAAVIGTVIQERNKVSNQICDVIERKCADQNECQINMAEITNFSWDKMLLYQVGMTRSQVSEILDVEFSYELDMESGMVFVKDNKVVYHESFFHDGETRVRLWIRVGDFDERYFLCPADNANLSGSKEIREDGKTYYSIGPFEKNP